MNKIDSMTGRTYGKLTVVETIGSDKCLCKCECGNIKVINAANIRSGKSKSCGCGEKLNREKKLEIAGKKFGRLKAVESTTERRDGCVVWKCQCDCGNICYITSRNLVRGDTKSCGCIRKEKSDIVGQYFGKLMAIKIVKKKKNRHPYWLCKCECGNYVIVQQNNLKNGHTKSCGCMQDRHQLKFYKGSCISRLESKRLSKRNKSGVTGVSFCQRSQKWQARIVLQRKTFYLGDYSNLEDAVNARIKAEKIHENFIEEYYKEVSKEK